MTSPASNEQIFHWEASVFKAVVERVVAFGKPWIRETPLGTHTQLTVSGTTEIQVKVIEHVATMQGLEALLDQLPVGSTMRLDVQYRATSVEIGSQPAHQGVVTVHVKSAEAVNASFLEKEWVGKEFFFQFKRKPTQYVIRETGQRFEKRGVIMWAVEQSAWIEEQMNSPRCELIRL